MRTKRPSGRRFPPVLIAVLIVIWLLLNQTLSFGYAVLGTVLACLITWWCLRLRPLQPRLSNLHLVPGLVMHVLEDIVRSNIGVARVVLGLTGKREVHSDFLEIPLELRDPHGLAVLASIVTATPGTVWVDLSSDNVLTLHVLDLRDPDAWRQWIKTRYEEPLVRIFQ